MLSSLLTAYITTQLKPEFLTEEARYGEQSAIVQTASISFEDLVDQNRKPVKKPQFISPIVDAKASISIDLKTGESLYSKNIHDRLPIASITKLMTALLIIENGDLDQEVKISAQAATAIGSTMYLRTGEIITREDLLKGLLINSANDAAIALAEDHSGTIGEFVKNMNERALELGLVNTRFANPTGLDQYNNYSSASDIAKLGKFIFKNNDIKEIVQTKTTNVYSADKNYKHELESTNELLGNEYFDIKGLKTGQTDEAGLCLVAIAANENDKEILTVVLGSPDRFKESKILIDWIFRAYDWPTT